MVNIAFLEKNINNRTEIFIEAKTMLKTQKPLIIICVVDMAEGQTL